MLYDFLLGQFLFSLGHSDLLVWTVLCHAVLTFMPPCLVLRPDLYGICLPHNHTVNGCLLCGTTCNVPGFCACCGRVAAVPCVPF
jgi:hypothetical protein